MSAYRPYPKTKPSGVEWLGDVPEGWVVARIKNVATINASKSEVSHLDPETEVSFLPMEAVGDDGTLDATATRKLGDVLTGYTYVRENDVLVAKITPCFENGKGCIARGLNNGIGFATTEVVPIRHNKRSIPEFLYYLLHGLPFRKVAEGSMYGAGGQKRVSDNFVAGYSFALPPLPEQIQIASFLDRECGKLDALQAKQERLIELLKEKRQALISHTVTKGLDPNAKLKPSGIEWLGDVPEHWQTGRIKTVSRFTTSGPRGWSERVGETGALFVQSGDLNDRLEIEFASTRRVDVEGNAETSRTRLRDGDVVVCITGAKTGNVAVCDRVPEEAYINQHLCMIRPNRKFASRFVGTVLKSHLGRSYFDVSQYGLKQGLSLEDVLEAPMPLPPLAEQRAIVAHLDDKCGRMDALIAKAERAITLLKERRSALISAAVTGKIDVRKN